MLPKNNTIDQRWDLSMCPDPLSHEEDQSTLLLWYDRGDPDWLVRHGLTGRCWLVTIWYGLCLATTP